MKNNEQQVTGVEMSFHLIQESILMKEIAAGKKVIVIDPEQEYMEFAKLMNGEIKGKEIIFNKNSSTLSPINPFEINI